MHKRRQPNHFKFSAEPSHLYTWYKRSNYEQDGCELIVIEIDK